MLNRITIIFLIGFFIDCINIFMSAIALPDIANAFQISQSNTIWIANSYIVGLTLIIPLSHWLSNYFNSRTMLTLSMLGFSLSACGVGFGSNFLFVVFCRFFQGLFGGLFIPIGQALTFNLFTQTERAKVSSMIMSIALIAPTLSPVVGGLIVDHLSWRWIFLCHIPLGLLTAILAWLWIKEDTPTTKVPDLKGITLISGALITLLISISVDMTTPYLLINFILSMIFIRFYYRHILINENCVLNLSLLTHHKMLFSLIIYYIIPAIFNGVNLLTIFLLQNVMHWHASTTGLLMVLYGIGCACSIRYCAFNYNRLGYQKLFKSAIFFHIIGILCLCLVSSFNAFLFVAYILMGIGGGLGANTAQTTAMIDFTEHQLQQASLLWNLNRQISFCIMPTVLLFIFKLLQTHFSIVLSYQMLPNYIFYFSLAGLTSFTLTEAKQ